MDDETKNLIDFALGLAQLVALLVGGVWAFRRFRVEGTHTPRIEFGIECEFLGPHRGAFLAAFTITADNRGLVEHHFNEIRLRVRGVRRDHPLQVWEERPPMALFPESITKGANIVPPEYGYFFVRPGVHQRFSYALLVPEEIRFVAARATFKYQDTGDIHTTERVFEVRTRTEAV